jgi:hypothetical protein
MFGAFQFIINIFYLLCIWGILKINKTVMKILIALLIFEFTINLLIAVVTAINLNYYLSIWGTILMASEAVINNLPYP